MDLNSAIGLTILGSCLISFSWIFQKRAAVQLPKITMRFSASTLVAFLTSSVWLTGLMLMMVGFGIFQVAIAFTGEISILQPMFGSGLILLAVIAVVFLNERFSLIEWISLAVLIAGVTVLGATAEQHHSEFSPLGLLLVFAVVLLVLGGTVASRARLPELVSVEFLLGATGGLFQGLGIILMGVFSYYNNLRMQGIADTPLAFLLIPIAIAFFTGSLTLMQSGIQRGRALVVVIVNSVLTNIVAIIGGIVVLEEDLPKDPFLATLQMGAFVAIIFGSATLARLGR